MNRIARQLRARTRLCFELSHQQVKTLYTTDGQPFLVSDEDYAVCSVIKWTTYRGGCKNKPHFYVHNTRVGYLHRFILGAPPQFLVDHWNCDARDNRRENLRLATKAENNQNTRTRSDNTSGYKGVCFDKASGRWEANVKLKGKNKKVGRFASAELADAAVCAARSRMHKEFARNA